MDRWLRRRGAGYLAAVAAVAVVTLAVALVQFRLRLGHASPLYLTAVLACGAIFGRGPAVLAAALSFLAYDWFFVPPFHTFNVADPDEWVALLLFLCAALVTGQLTALLRHRAAEANRREREALALHEIGKALIGTGPLRATLAAALARMQETLRLATCDILLPEGSGGGPSSGPYLVPLFGAPLSSSDAATAAWVFEEGKAAWRGWARGSHRLVRLHRRRGDGNWAAEPAAVGSGPPSGGRDAHSPAGDALAASFLPLVVEGHPVGVLYAAVAPGRQQFGAEESRFLTAAGDQLALAVERGRLQRDQVQAEVLKRTDDLRAALLSAVSHDLRTPLSAITAAAGSLLQEDVAWDDANRRAFAAQIEREANRLNRLVGNLLDLSRIEAGAIKLDRQWYPLAPLVDDTIARMDRTLAEHQVVNAVPDDLPPVPLDYVLVQQVLTNLLENAARYAPAGTPIRVSAEVRDEWVRVRVADQGPGVPAAERQRIFQSFYRATQQRDPEAAPVAPVDGRSSAHGKGLGLAVCAGFVAAHGGRIWVEDSRRRTKDKWGLAEDGGSRTESGAVFVIELPLSPVESTEPAATAAAGAVAAHAWPPDGGRRAPAVYRPRRARRVAVA